VLLALLIYGLYTQPYLPRAYLSRWHMCRYLAAGVAVASCFCPLYVLAEACLASARVGSRSWHAFSSRSDGHGGGGYSGGGGGYGDGGGGSGDADGADGGGGGSGGRGGCCCAGDPAGASCDCLGSARFPLGASLNFDLNAFAGQDEEGNAWGAAHSAYASEYYFCSL